MKDFSNDIEHILCNDDVLQQSIDSAVNAVCDTLGISSDDYVHRISIAEDGLDMSHSARSKRVQQDINNYLAKGGKVATSPFTGVQLTKDLKDLDAQLAEIQRKAGF